MDECMYLIAIALIEQDGKLAMPLGGKSLKKPISPERYPEDEGKLIALDLLLRLLQRSEDGSLRRVAGDRSLLLVQMPIVSMQEHLPSLKAHWLNNGDTDLFLAKMDALCTGVWSLNFLRYEGLNCNRLCIASNIE